MPPEQGFQTADLSPPLPAEILPELTDMIAAAQVPEAVHVALDARLAEKRHVEALSQELLAIIRPELERLTEQLVTRSVAQLWHQRAKRYEWPASET